MSSRRGETPLGPPGLPELLEALRAQPAYETRELTLPAPPSGRRGLVRAAHPRLPANLWVAVGGGGGLHREVLASVDGKEPGEMKEELLGSFAEGTRLVFAVWRAGRVRRDGMEGAIEEVHEGLCELR
jgi:hypothetical protein